MRIITIIGKLSYNRYPLEAFSKILEISLRVY